MTRATAALVVLVLALGACTRSQAARGPGARVAAAECEATGWWRSPGEMLAYPDSLPEGPAIEVARAEINLLSLSILRFCRSRGTYPRTLSELAAHERTLPPGEPCTYAAGRATDPWGTAYVYAPGARGFHLSSAGPDRIAGTADDVGRPAAGDPGTERVDVREVCVRP